MALLTWLCLLACLPACGRSEPSPVASRASPRAGIYVAYASDLRPLVVGMFDSYLSDELQSGTRQQQAKLRWRIKRASEVWARALEYELALYPDGRSELRYRMVGGGGPVPFDPDDSPVDQAPPYERALLVGTWQRRGQGRFTARFDILNGRRLESETTMEGRALADGRLRVGSGWRCVTFDEPPLRLETRLRKGTSAGQPMRSGSAIPSSPWEDPYK
jgi:hypothetical protein